jgi:ABC-type amino acid transport substrate-binding protein
MRLGLSSHLGRASLSPYLRVAEAIVWLSLPLVGSGQASDAPTTLRVGMDTRTPPWVFVPGLDFAKEDQTKAPLVTPEQLRKIEGLDVDVMKALARRMEIAFEVVPTAWPELEKGLLQRRYDVLICGWTPNSKTPEPIGASLPYHTWGLLLAVRSDSAIRSVPDLDGRRVGHYRDPAVARSLYAMGHGTFVAGDDPGMLFAQLKGGTLDAVVFDSLYVRWRVANDPTFRVVGAPLNHLGYHVGVLKENAGLFERVRAAVKDLVGSHEMAEILYRWERSP